MDAAARALGEPHRREILRLVHGTERTVGDIADQLPISRPAVSQHLRVLEDAELVTHRRDGTRHWYRARPEGFAELHEWLQGFWADRLDTLKATVERDQWNDRRGPHS